MMKIYDIIPEEDSWLPCWIVLLPYPESLNHTATSSLWLAEGNWGWLFQGHPVNRDGADIWVHMSLATKGIPFLPYPAMSSRVQRGGPCQSKHSAKKSSGRTKSAFSKMGFECCIPPKRITDLFPTPVGVSQDQVQCSPHFTLISFCKEAKFHSPLIEYGI